MDDEPAENLNDFARLMVQAASYLHLDVIFGVNSGASIGLRDFNLQGVKRLIIS